MGREKQRPDSIPPQTLTDFTLSRAQRPPPSTKPASEEEDLAAFEAPTRRFH